MPPRAVSSRLPVGSHGPSHSGALSGDQAHGMQHQPLPSEGRARRRISCSRAKVSLENYNEDLAMQRKRLRGVINPPAGPPLGVVKNYVKAPRFRSWKKALMCVRKIWALISASAANQPSDLKAGNIVSETQFPQLELREVAGQEERGHVRSLSPPPLPPPVPPSLPPISTPTL